MGTANNDDVLDRADVVDTADVTVRLPERVREEDFARWMQDQTSPMNPSRSGRVRAGWNYYGDNRCEFIDVSVTAVEPRGGTRIVDTQNDPLVGARVRLGLAVMVDLDPKGFANTQIFADSLEILRDGGRRFGGRPGRFHCRWLNLNRNLSAQGFDRFSAVFHASIPNSELDWDITDSAALEGFRAEVERGAGIGIRFCVYLLAPHRDDETLAKQYRTGQPVANPATGRLVGTLSVWQSGELASVTMGRLLVPSGTMIDDKHPVPLGTAVAGVDEDAQCVTLDLVNTFPEEDQSGRKALLGEVVLRTRHPTQAPDIGPVPYDQTTYEQTAGIVEVPFHPALAPTIAAGELVLITEKSGEMLAEAPIMVESDDRCVYLQQGESATVRFAALARGVPLVEPVRFLAIDEPGADASGQVVEFAEAIDVGGTADNLLTLRAVRPGCTVIRLDRSPGARQLDTARDHYISVRVLPTDDYDHLGDDEITFPLIYQEILRYYHHIHPAMSRLFDLSDESVVTAVAESLLRRTEPSNWSRARYMPRTRDLSAGKRRLLERWCRKVSAS